MSFVKYFHLFFLVAFFYTQWLLSSPIITNLSPNVGPTTFGTLVIISGVGFTEATSVLFGTVEAPTFNIVSDTEITAIAPESDLGTVQVIVNSPSVSSNLSSKSYFTYQGLWVSHVTVLKNTSTSDSSTLQTEADPNVSYIWDFGDGTKITCSTPTAKHKYALPADYHVKLKVINPEGVFDSDYMISVDAEGKTKTSKV